MHSSMSIPIFSLAEETLRYTVVYIPKKIERTKIWSDNYPEHERTHTGILSFGFVNKIAKQGDRLNT